MKITNPTKKKVMSKEEFIARLNILGITCRPGYICQSKYSSKEFDLKLNTRFNIVKNRSESFIRVFSYYGLIHKCPTFEDVIIKLIQEIKKDDINEH